MDMSSDTGMENASVVDSSVTEWKHDVENLEDQESPSYKGGDDTCPSGAEEHVHNCDQAEDSIASKRKKLYGARYFIIKSLNYQNIELSIKKGIWATQVMNEPILEEAFRNSRKVILIFSVNMSGFFQGYAQMISSVGWRRDNVWTQGSGGKNPWGRSFRVKWLRLYDLPFQKTLHIKNPWNDYKPVKISRDCQELPQDIGEALCSLLDGKDDTNGNLERDDIASRRPPMEPPCPLPDETCNMPPLHMAWAHTPMLYPSLFYQRQADASRFHLAHLPITSGVSKVMHPNHAESTGSLTSVRLDQDSFSQYDGFGCSAQRSPHASTLTEDDFLEMSYEEYVKSHSRRNKRSYHHVGLTVDGQATGPSQRARESPNTERVDDLCSRSHSSKRTQLSSHK